MIFIFIDKARITVEGGNGGNGCVAFRREKFVVAGGPSGGDGGKGGNVIFVGDSNLNSLVDFKFKRKYKADNGENGKNKNMTGRGGSDVIIQVPLGTVIKEAKSGKVMIDIRKEDEEKILIAGGRGGRGNQHFATSRRQAPRFAEKGKDSKKYELIMELKLIADVGIIGFPNAGKSTLLKMVTNANPKIANYHFTTLSPNLGVVRLGDGSDFILADIPGLIEGASDGIGLGHEFLRHVERTKILIHVVDTSGLEGEDPIDLIEKINNELYLYNEKLKKYPQVIAANKMDLIESEENISKLKEKYEKEGFKVFPISAATNTGLNELINYVYAILKDMPEVVFEEEFDPFVEEEIDESIFEVEKENEGYYTITGQGVEKMIVNTNFSTEKGLHFLHKYLKDKGILDVLKEKGAEEGDIVYIYGFEFDYF